MEKKIRNKVWFSCGRIYGFGIGFTINRYFFDLQLGFWYIGLEY